MEYLYLPTTTLNFNDMLSTGSISPATFYTKRGFGIKRFETVEPNPFKHVLLLYSRCPKFEIRDEERDNYPLLVQIPINDNLLRALSKQICKQDGVVVYTYAQTIYFDQWSARFIFYTQDELRTTIAKTEPSLTTKLVQLYEQRFYSSTLDLDTFEWSKSFIPNIDDAEETKTDACIKNDHLINRLKGFCWGYILGAYKSLPIEVAKARLSYNNFSNEMSAMLNAPLVNNIDIICKDAESGFKIFDKVFESDVIGLVRFELTQGDSIKLHRNQVENIGIPNNNTKASTRLFIQIVNDYCLKSNFFGDLDEKRKIIVDDIATLIGKTMAGKWEPSDERDYFLSLRSNIVKSTPLEFGSLNNLALQSFAAFVLKGDDLEKLESYLVSQGMCDFRFSFALWGAMFGFSKIPKTLFNLPIKHGDEKYLNEMYRYVHGIVYEVPVEDLQSSVWVKQSSNERQAPEVEEIETVLQQFLSKLPDCKIWCPKLKELLEDAGGLNEKFIAQLDTTQVAVLGGKIKGITKKEVAEYFNDALSPSTSNSNGITSSKNGQRPERGALQIPANGKSDYQEQGTLEFQSRIDFRDEKVWNVIKKFIRKSKWGETKEDMNWFHNEWINPDSTYYPTKSNGSLKDRTNDDAISSFLNYLYRRKYLTLVEQDINFIRTELKKKYS